MLPTIRIYKCGSEIPSLLGVVRWFLIHNVPLQLAPGSRVTQLQSQLSFNGESQSLFPCLSPCVLVVSYGIPNPFPGSYHRECDRVTGGYFGSQDAHGSCSSSGQLWSITEAAALHSLRIWGCCFHCLVLSV